MTDRVQDLRELVDAIPTNWVDDLLTGPNGIGQPPYDCCHIERLLRGVKSRLSELAEEIALRDASSCLVPRTPEEEQTRKACLRCEGRGTVRERIDLAGAYHVRHCASCGGIGKERKDGR